MSQLFDDIQSNVALQKQVHLNMCFPVVGVYKISPLRALTASLADSGFVYVRMAVLTFNPVSDVSTRLATIGCPVRLSIYQTEENIRIHHECEGGVENPSRGSLIGIPRCAE